MIVSALARRVARVFSLLLVFGFPVLAAPVRFQAYALHESRVLFPAMGGDTPFVEVDWKYLYPTSARDSAVLARLRSGCASLFFSREISSPAAALREDRDSYFRDYADACAELDSATGIPAFMWSNQNRMKATRNDSDALVIEVSAYSYSGGAHGLYGRSYTNFDPATGETISLANIFKPEAVERLGPMIERKILRDWSRRAGERVTREEFLADTIEATSNFQLTKKGIVFHYGVYEVAPYAVGEFDILLSFGEIMHLMRADAARRWAHSPKH